MLSTTACFLFANVVTNFVLPANAADGFLQGGRSASDLADRGAEFQSAMESLMGCGGTAVDSDARAARLAKIESDLATSWRALPKNNKGNVEWRMLRYVAHRYFMQKSSLFIRGFEPARQVNDTALGTAEILNTHQPLLVEKLIENRQATDGFKLEDAVAMIASLEQVIFDSESIRLEKVYMHQKKSPQQSLSHTEVSLLMESYMVHWMIGEDEKIIRYLLKNKTLLPTAFPHWEQIKHFANGMVRSMEFQQMRSPMAGHGRAALAEGYSFDDVHQATASMTNTFASYWETECQAIKTSLVALDKTGTGRIPLSDFYGANSDGEWRFGESESYLRELGALDESSAWRGKQVIITNYLLGASNCIVTTPHYLVCCVNECEDVLNDVEDAIGAPMALADDVLSLVSNMHDFNDARPKIDKALQNQLQRVAEAHGGKVPLHGRLFAQWLHYVFPRECPFPHKAGSFTSLTPIEFGDQYIASDTEVNMHAARRGDAEVARAEERAAEEEWSQWSDEEELQADYTVHMSAPWDRSRGFLFVAGAIATGAVLVWRAVTAGDGSKSTSSAFNGAHSFESKAHFV